MNKRASSPRFSSRDDCVGELVARYGEDADVQRRRRVANHREQLHQRRTGGVVLVRAVFSSAGLSLERLPTRHCAVREEEGALLRQRASNRAEAGAHGCADEAGALRRRLACAG